MKMPPSPPVVEVGVCFARHRPVGIWSMLVLRRSPAAMRLAGSKG
ncbi:MAG: hypothetical protein ONB46_14100 [candidate division KSB1 bacterium]|nr:hypothetical protein [candidate division KSB1 bacterium]MDZ7366927.1 hypothetical protein [candidate division KSB1 bacterium]MDZ7406096.1 hypothetical protein [candidate division KSB1 bacterium]